jgi:hypothetical protein
MGAPPVFLAKASTAFRAYVHFFEIIVQYLY